MICLAATQVFYTVAGRSEDHPGFKHHSITLWLALGLLGDRLGTPNWASTSCALSHAASLL